MCIDDIDTANESDAVKEIIRSEGIGALAFVPLVINGGVIGKFMLYHDTPHAFTEEERELALTIARQLGFAIERQRAAVYRREAEASLRASAERQHRADSEFRALADNIHQFAWMTDASGWIYWYNQRWFDYTGATLEDMQGWGWRKVHHPDHVDRVVEKFARCIEAGAPWEDTFPLRSKKAIIAGSCPARCRSATKPARSCVGSAPIPISPTACAPTRFASG
ncbi:MAG: GAF domain-containing protein [Hyphomonadaceae bacterium]